MRVALLFLVVAGAACAETRPDAAPEATTDALWRALSHGPGEGVDVERLGALFHRDARVYGVSYAEGKSRLGVRAAADFVARQGHPGRDGFHEREVFRQVHAYGDFAQVFATVESRTDPAAEQPDFTGVNSVHLYREDGRWRILALYYGLEPPNLALPREWRGGAK